jgi:HlyD family secretion protein
VDTEDVGPHLGTGQVDEEQLVEAPLANQFRRQTVDGIGTYPTILAIDNSDLRLRPGMTASADVTVEEVKGVLAVPNAAFRYTPPLAPAATRRSSGLLGMLFSGGSPGDRNRQTTTKTNALTKEGFRNLYILKDDEPTRIAVKTGVTDGDTTQILEGPLTDGDFVITAQSSR